VRRDDAQAAGGLLADALQFRLEFLPVRQQPPRPIETALAVLRQADAVGRPAQQAHAERALERLQPAADGRLRRRELGGCGGEAARLHDPHEGFQQLDAVGIRCRFRHARSV
jgi:hypothetical protein